MSYPPDQRVQGCWKHMIQISKHSLREQMQLKRRNLSMIDVSVLSKLIDKQLKADPLFNECENLGTYMAFDNEPSLSIPKNKRILLPKIHNEKLTFHLNENKFKKNKFGIEEPVNDNIFPINDIHLILIPLIAFNIDLYRIGYGSGYYDKTLEHISKISAGPKLWGIGYDFQMVDINFQDKFDIRLDKVITEKNIYV